VLRLQGTSGSGVSPRVGLRAPAGRLWCAL